MSYPRTLDDYSDKELIDELERRQKSRIAGCCDYCAAPSWLRPCKHEERHKAKPFTPVEV